MNRFARPLSGCLAAVALALLSACAGLPLPPPPPAEFAGPDPNAPRLPPAPTRHFEGVRQNHQVLGELQVLFARDDNTLVDIARHHNLGFDELHHANPGVDTWLPGEGTPVYLPTMWVIPDAPREGIVLNLPSMRLFYFEPERPSAEADGTSLVTVHPIGIGREGWATPTGEARVKTKARDPTWYPPASVRAEHAEAGDPLPGIVPPGPENPLGRFALGLSLPSYLIHGTNKPGGVGMRVSHGCIRLFPEDIEALFDRVTVGTPVTIVDQPLLAGWRDGQLYLEVNAPLAEDERDLDAEAARVIAAALQDAGQDAATVDTEAVARLVAERNGIPYPILLGETTPDRYLTNARVIENEVPETSTETVARQ
jgi:L,D-transpeptidase ErfK/SrfK